VNMEFIRDEKRKLYWFLECNPRFSGGAAFTEKAGYPLVENAMRAYEGKEIEAASGITEGFLVKKYVEVSTGL
jgi:carbamoyl-phosphate synthase large subunit